jgi:type II secretory pathway pseudopilin PulG
MRRILFTIILLTPIMFLSSCVDELQLMQIKATDSTINALRTACEVYKLDTGAYPPASLLPDCLLTNPPVTGWKGPYLLVSGKGVPKDGWGQDFQYVVEGTNITIFSAGRDGRFGTKDDQDGRRIQTLSGFRMPL